MAYTLKISKRSDHRISGYLKYVVPPSEGFWLQDGADGAVYSDKSTFNWISVVRSPACITGIDLDRTVETWAKKKKVLIVPKQNT